MEESDLRTCRLIRHLLEKHRKARGFSMDELAVAAKRDVKTVKRVFWGEPTFMGTARAIADALGVKLASLVLWPPESPMDKPHVGYGFSITTIGLVETEEQLALISDVANEIVQRLSASNIKIQVHEQNLRSMQRSKKGPYAVLRVRAPRSDLKRCAGPSRRSRHDLAYIFLSLDQYDELLHDDWDERCHNLFIDPHGMSEIGFLSGQVWEGRNECELIESVLREWCAQSP